MNEFDEVLSAILVPQSKFIIVDFNCHVGNSKIHNLKRLMETRAIIQGTSQALSLWSTLWLTDWW